MELNINSITGIPSYDKMNIGFVLIVIIVIITYYLLFSSLGNNASNVGETSNIMSMELLLWSVFVLLLLLNGMTYLFNVDITTSLKNMFTPNPTIDITLNNVENEKPIKKKEVFHIPGNTFQYDEAKKMCKKYHSKLANFKELNDAYNKGADWCSYGWSDGQMALFPTQDNKWQKLQGIDGHENDCGRPGINGGYIEDSKLKFGVNCFGYKPKIKEIDQKNMSKNRFTNIINKKSEKDKKNEVPNVIVAPFNNESWNSS
tara:strand:- start:105 stop:881 length:777 start_codon:yes stop_codon:yes gene_type:complete